MDYQKLSIKEFEQKLMRNILRIKPAPFSIQQSDAMSWTNENLLIRNSIYDTKPYKNRLNEDYTDKLTPLMEEKIIKAWFRLAAILNKIFEQPIY